MTTTTADSRPTATHPQLRITWVWAVTGTAFVAYPVLRPYADETTLAGLAAMASGRWLLAHLLGMVAFALLPLAVTGLRGSRPGSRALAAAGPLSVVAAALLLPYYGGEAFALNAIGRRGVATGDLGLLTVVDGFRYQPLALGMFAVGLIAVAAVGVLLVVGLWRGGRVTRLAALAVGLGLATYLPQFFGTPGLRMTHGLVLAVGCWALALGVARANRVPGRPSTSR